MHVRTDPELLPRVPSERVENGLYHTDRSHPTIELLVETAGQGVALWLVH